MLGREEEEGTAQRNRLPKHFTGCGRHGLSAANNLKENNTKGRDVKYFDQY